MPDAIALDIPCFQCGYNLRGLPQDSQCPECGAYVGASIREWTERQRRTPDIERADPRWLRNVAEGAIVAVAVFILMIALAVASAWCFAWKSPQRRWTLGVACTMWVLSWFASWKLTTPPRPKPESPSRWRIILRVSATMIGGSPFLVYFLPEVNAAWPLIVVVIILLIAGWVASAAWFGWVGALLKRCRGRAAGIALLLSRVLLFFGPLVYFGDALPGLDSREDSLSGVLTMHVCQFGSTDLIAEMISVIRQGYRPYLLLMIAMILPVGGIVIVVCLGISLWRAQTVSKTLSKAG